GEPPSIVLSVGYVGGDWPDMDKSVQWIIRKHAPSYYFDLKEVYLVGSIYLVLGNVSANGLELRTNVRVVNLTYSQDLGHQMTSAFQYQSHLFCRDMKRFYAQSAYSDRFYDCGVDSFTDKPVLIHFYLVFHGTSSAGLSESIIDVIRRFGRPVYYLMYLTYLVGDLLVLPEDIPLLPSVHPTNITVFPTSTLMTMTSSPSEIRPTMSSSEATNDYGVMLILYYELYNLTYTDDYKNPMSRIFKEHKNTVCDD
ncbi:neurogenic locus notch protein 1-like isoform X2, partial [Biomphalaria pfeifferi]